MKVSYGFWLGWFALILIAVGLFHAPYWFGGGALLLGLICLTTPHKILAWSSIILATMVLLIQLLQ